MTDEDTNLPVQTEKPSLLDYLDSLLPFRIPRLPFVRTAANLDKAAARLVLANAEHSAARKDAATAKIKHQSNVEGRFLESAERIAEQALKRNEIPIDVALRYLEGETNIRFSNRAKVFEEAVKQLTFDPPIQDSQKSIDDDWLNMFSRLAEDKSSEELQSLFGKILAGEIREPGAINLRTLTVVSTLTSNEANRIVEAYQFVLRGSFIPSIDDIKLPDFNSLKLLGEMGIVTGIGGLFFSTLRVAPQQQSNLFGTKNGIGIRNMTDIELSYEIGALYLTEAGTQLYKIAKISETPLSYLRAVALAIAEGRSNLSLNPLPLAGKAELVLLTANDGAISVVESVLSNKANT